MSSLPSSSRMVAREVEEARWDKPVAELVTQGGFRRRGDPLGKDR